MTGRELYREDICNRLYGLCVARQYFTCGCQLSYNRLFELVRAGSCAREVAAVIWVCSDEMYTFDFVYADVVNIMGTEVV